MMADTPEPTTETMDKTVKALLFVILAVLVVVVVVEIYYRFLPLSEQLEQEWGKPEQDGDSEYTKPEWERVGEEGA
jgi:flagellar basal body-associated protein FliL